MLSYLFMFIVVAGMGALGYWRGGMRLGLYLAPLILASLLLWMFGGLFYHIDFLRNLGLIWPATILIIVGLALGYTVRFVTKKRLPKEIHQYDRIAGSVIGVFLAVIITWLGVVYYWVYSTSHQRDVSYTTTSLARTLNNGVIRWIPGVGSGSEAIMVLTEIAAADEEVQQQAIEDLGIDDLQDLPEIQRVLNDAEVNAAIERMQGGNPMALLSLQKHPLILQLAESEDVQVAVDRLSLHTIAEALRNAEQTVKERREREDQ